MSDLGSLDSIRLALEGVEGWFSDPQVTRLHRAALSVGPDATIVEIGSFRGRSTIVLGRSAPSGATIVAIDPHAGTDRGPREIVTTSGTGDRDHEAFCENLAAAGLADRIEHVREYSDRAHHAVAGDVDLLFIDGAHRYGPARRDLADWGARVVPGGRMLVHDAFNSVGVTFAQLRELVFSSRWRYLGRSGSLAEYERTDLHGMGRLADAARQLAQLGYFVQSIAIKVALSLRLRPLARLLGHRTDAPWPY